MSIQKLQVFGNKPLPRFGHTITYYAPNKVVMFGGATGNTGQFNITDNTYIYDIATKFWKKAQTTGTAPSPRAAHAAVLIQKNQIVIYGGATATGGLASDDLYLLDLKDNIGIWNTININGKTPGRRYGHILSYTKPYLVLFGGMGQKLLKDCWVLNVQKSPISWVQITSVGQTPCARNYHSAAICTTGSANGMIVIFGGRSGDQQALNDSWGLRRHRNGSWDWVRAPYKEKNIPCGRYQHTSIFLGSAMIVIGGRTNKVEQSLKLQIYDTENSEWSSFDTVQRFRHQSWLFQNSLYIYGGFELATPNLPTDQMVKINLNILLKQNNSLYSKLDKIGQKKQNTSIVKTPTSPMLGNQSRKTGNFNGVLNNKPDSKFVMLEPVIGKVEEKYKPNMQIKKNLNSKFDIPHYFLNNLLQPKNYMNIESLRFTFKPQHVLTLCQLAENIITQQPIVLKVRAPLKIFGDIHGQYSDLMSFFALYGTPHQNGKKKDIQNFDYIFLGDFVDRGSHSLQTICLLLALKVLYPQQIHLIRGNHQDGQINCSFGFSQQCAEKCQEDPNQQQSVFAKMNKLFQWLPLAAVVQQKILCLHGGIGSVVGSVDDIMNIKRPIQVIHEVANNEQQLVLDILWSDPTQSDAQLGIYSNALRDPQGTGNIVKFGPDRVHDFLKKNNLSMIIRAHECVMDGFQRFAGGALITVFSATDYCKRHKNAGAILIIKTNLQIIPKLIFPSNSNSNNWIQDQESLNRRPPTPPRWRNQGARNN